MRNLGIARRVATGLGLCAALLAGSARADIVLLGSDYFETIAPTSFTFPVATSLGSLSGITLGLSGRPIGPGSTDTIVRRRQDCSLFLDTSGSQCTIEIEMVALSLVGNGPPILFRESPTHNSLGEMTIFSDGTGTGGHFDSFFDIFVELSNDGGQNFYPLGNLPLRLLSQGTAWSITEQGLLVDGLVGDQNANRHTDKAINCQAGTGMCVDFFLARSSLGGPGIVTELHSGGQAIHTARHAMPEPGSLALVSLFMLILAARSRRGSGKGSLLR